MRGRARRLTPLATALVAGALLAGCGVAAAPRIVGAPSTSINVPLQVVACTSRDVCAAVGTSLQVGGPTSTGEWRRASGAWAPLRTPAAADAFLFSSACTPSACLFAGTGGGSDLLWRFDAAPPSVAAVAGPAGGAAVDAVTCVGSLCDLVDRTSGLGPLRWVQTTDVGATWSTPAAIPGTGGWRATGLACASASRCLLALAPQAALSPPPATAAPAHGARLLATDDGGLTWSDVALPAAWSELGSLTCQGAVCDALATTPARSLWARSVDAGRRWTARRTGYETYALACTRAHRCVLAGTTGLAPWAATTRGTTLRAAGLRYVNSPFTAVACGSTLCALVNNSTVAALRP